MMTSSSLYSYIVILKTFLDFLEHETIIRKHFRARLGVVGVAHPFYTRSYRRQDTSTTTKL